MAKWLTEISRKRYQEVIIEKSSLLMSRLAGSDDRNQTPNKRVGHIKSLKNGMNLDSTPNYKEPFENKSPKIEDKVSATKRLQAKLKEFNEDICKNYFPRGFPVQNVTANIALRQIYPQYETRIASRIKSRR